MIQKLHIIPIFLFALFFWECGNETHKQEIQSLSNVVVIVGDDHAYTTLGCYGNPDIKTPNLDRLASEGMLFTRAYANAPMCSASRQSMLTGKYPHATGVTLLRTSFPDENITIAEHLKPFGFKSAIIGKDHFNNSLHHGFDEKIGRRDWSEIAKRAVPDSIDVQPPWKPFRDPASIWLNAATLPVPYFDEDMPGTFYTRKAVDFIERNKENRFLLWLAYHEPHSPFYFPVEDAGSYDGLEVELPTMSDEDEAWMPAVFKDLTPQQKKGIIKSYYTSVSHLDKNIGVVLDKLKELKLDDNTLIMYVGDHGYLLADHGRFEKHMMWEEAIRTPLIIKAGNNSIAGTRSGVLTEFIDIAPTIMDALQVEAMKESQGRSLWPVVSQVEKQHKDAVFAEYLVDNKAMLCNGKWKYVYSTGERDLGQGYATGNPPMGVTHRLYDLVNDPGETTDVGSNPANQQLLKEMQLSMIETFKRTDPRASELPDGLSVEETLAWFCVPPDAGADLDAQ